MCILVTHPEFAAQEFYVAITRISVLLEGPEDDYFVDEPEQELQQDAPGEDTTVEDVARATLPVQVGKNWQEAGVEALRAAGVEVDDDNEPNPENIPVPGQALQSIFSDTLGHGGVDFRRVEGGRNERASLRNATAEISTNLTPLQLFQFFFPINHIKEVILPIINASVSPEVTYGEFLCYLGLWFLMATTYTSDRRQFWSKEEANPWSDAPYRFNQYMSCNRFDLITSTLQSTNVPSTAYKDPFYPIRQLIGAWNDNMTEVFCASWISVLDESMCPWTSKWTCPGWMFLGPRQMGLPEFEAEKGKTAGLLLHMTRQLWGTAKFVVMDSGFCVLEALIELRKKGVFSTALIKKRHYWPKYIDGDKIDLHFADKEVGTVDALKGQLNGVDFYVYGMREPDYVMKMMGTCLTLGEVQDGDTARTWKKSDGTTQTKRFKYTSTQSLSTTTSSLDIK
jgi:hypothetical protein